jgi:hypothetical protein
MDAEPPSFLAGCATVAFVSVAVGGAVGLTTRSIPPGLLVAGLSLLVGWILMRVLIGLRHWQQGDWEAIAYRRLERFLADQPDWSVRVYKTPLGLRLLATHRLFDPLEQEVVKSFQRLEVDVLYARMCERQRCFRARVSAKPWRAGVTDHLQPRPGVWPVQAERMRERGAWVARYELAAKSFSACRYVQTLGSGRVHPTIKSVIELHDRLSGATTNLPIA